MFHPRGVAQIARASAVAMTVMLLCPSLRAQQVPVVPADQAAATFRLAPGYRVELVAAEPLVRDPVSVAFDADGRLWVVELQSFMQDVVGTGMYDPIGTVAVLEDTDGDGRMDRRTEFLGGLRRPRAVAFVEDGVLVNDAPNLWFCRDTDGDGICDEQTWVAAYGVEGSHENNPGSLTPALDNWIYSSNHGTRVRRQNGQWLVQPTPARGQWGMSQDDTGRLFYSTNREFIRGDLVPVTSPEAHSPGSRVNTYMMPPEEQYTQSWPLEGYYVWPGRPNYGIHRGYWPGALRADGTMISTTASCGPVIYRGDNFPADARGNAFSCEPAGNLVRRMALTEAPDKITARNVYSQSEFLTSTDERFRPVNLFNGPDGCLYVVDMYKGIIVAAEYHDNNYLRDYVVNNGLDRPLHLGRIWRVVSDSRPRGPVPRLAGLSSDALVATLSHPNGWLRDTAQRLLVERKDPSTVGPLQSLANSGTMPAGLHAQWTVTGMGNVPPPPPPGNDVLLVYGFLDATATLAPGDAALKSRLESLGYGVTLKEAPQSQTSDANGKVLVLISSTVGSDDVNVKFRDVAVPVIDCEHAVFDDMRMTGPTYWTDFGYDQNDPGLLTIVDPSSPLSGGLSGDVQATGPPNGIEWSDWIVWATTPSSSAIKVAVHANEPNKIAVFAYEAGAPMVGMNAPARRVGFFFYRNTAAIATPSGWALFDAAVAWAANRRPPPVNAPPWVALDAPADGTVFPGAPLDITVSGRTTDPDGAVARIEFYDNSNFIGYVPIHFEPPGFVTPWTFVWTGVGAGSHSLRAVAVDNGGAATPVTLSISVMDGTGGADLAAYWAFDEGTGLTAADSSGSGNDGTLMNGPLWVSGVPGSAIRFNGADSHVAVGAVGSLADLGPMTVSAWIRPDSMGAMGLGRIVSKENGSPGRWMLTLDGSRNLSFAKDHAVQELQRTGTPDVISVGTWQHVAATWDGNASAGGVHLYVDGVETAYSLSQDGLGARVSDATLPLTIGNRPSLDRGFDGAIDEVRVYNRVLSAGEIATLAAGGPIPGTVPASSGSSRGGCGSTGMEGVLLMAVIGLLAGVKR